MKTEIGLGQYLDDILEHCAHLEALEWAEKILKSYIKNVAEMRVAEGNVWTTYVNRCVGEIRFALGEIYRGVGQLDKSIEEYIESVSIFKGINDQMWEAATLNGLGLTQMKKHQYSEAEENFQEAFKIVSPHGKATILRNLATIFRRTRRYEEATLFSTRASLLADQEKCGSEKIQIVLGQYLDEIFNYCLAEEALEWAENILKSYIMNVAEENVASEYVTLCVGEIRFSLGEIYRTVGGLDKSIDEYTKSLSIFRKFKDVLWEVATLNGLGLTQMEKGLHSEAEKTFRTALEFSETLGSYERGHAAILRNLGAVLDVMGDSEEGMSLCSTADMSELRNRYEGFADELLLYCGVCGKAFDDPGALTWNWGCEHAVCDDATCQVSGFL